MKLNERELIDRAINALKSSDVYDRGPMVAALRSLLDESDELRSLMAQKNERIGALEAELAEAHTNEGAQQTRIAQDSQQIQALQAELRQRQGWYEEAERLWNRKFDAYVAELAEKQRRIDECEALLLELEGLYAYMEGRDGEETT